MIFFYCLVFISLFLVFCWYINPFRIGDPSKLRVLLARIWIMFRRLIFFIGAVFFALGSIVFWSVDISFWFKLGATFSFLLMSSFLIFAAIFGQGWNKASFKDDIKLYEKVKEKYKWR
jgi:hypothetical protein